MIIKPKFNSSCPDNWQDFFRKESDDAFKKEHPIAYPILVLLGLAALLVPTGLYFVYAEAVLGNLTIWSALFGLLGGFFVGVGLFNIVAAFLGQYLGHKVTLNGIFWGVALMIVAVYLS